MKLNDFITRVEAYCDQPQTHKNFVGGAKPAAVLIPIIMREEPMVLLTRRSANLNSHAGQIGFAGGKIDEEDASPLDAALREAEEEIGLTRNKITCIGQLAPTLTRTGFEIVAIIALVKPDFTLTLNKGEVEEAFEVPLSFLMNEENHIFRARVFMGRERFYYAMPYQRFYIWGVTAGIIRHLWERLHPC